MNSLKISKQLIKIAKSIIAFDCMDVGDWYVGKKAVRRYDAIIDRVINHINSKLKEIGLPFDYALQYYDNLIYNDQNSYETTLNEYNIEEEAIGIALFSHQGNINVLPVVVNVPLLNQYQHLGIYTFQQIQKQVQITLWHELAHGLIQRFDDEQIQIPFDVNDEQVCQEFGRACGELNNSKLGKFILDYVK